MIFKTHGKQIGIYGIYIDDKIVYIGQSKQLSTRAQTHERNIRKGAKWNGDWYLIANQFYLHGHKIEFKVLEEVPLDQLIKTEERYIQAIQPIFNTRKNDRNCQIPTDYVTVANILNIEVKPFIGLDKMICKDRAEQLGWFGENYPDKNELYWWEYK